MTLDFWLLFFKMLLVHMLSKHVCVCIDSIFSVEYTTYGVCMCSCSYIYVHAYSTACSSRISLGILNLKRSVGIDHCSKTTETNIVSQYITDYKI